MQVLIYHVNRPRGQSIDEIGEFQHLRTKEFSELVYNDRWYDEYRTLLMTFEAYNVVEDIDGVGIEEVQIIPDEDVHPMSDFENNQHYLFSVKECAAMLGLSVQRVHALIDTRQLQARKKAGSLFLRGPDIIAFAQLDRPSHRPAANAKENP